MTHPTKPDFLEAGQGHKVFLLHSSVSGARQWRALMKALADRYHLIAINTFGYGKTEPWGADRPQTLADHAGLIAPFLSSPGEEFSVVGHSFGASVAMKAAALFKDQVRRLVLIEPNPFYLLRLHERSDAYQDIVTLRDAMRESGGAGAWDAVGKVFADYWTGDGSWDAMPDDRKSKFAQALRPNFHEWDAVLNEVTTLSEWQAVLPKETTVISAADTVRSIAEICGIMEESVPAWTYEVIGRGGHMAALTQPDVINPIVARALA